MKTTFPLFLLILLSIPSIGICQTNIIAHKSHSGDMSTFVDQGDHSFGMPPNTIRKIIRLSDTSLVEVGTFRNDTLINHPFCIDPEITLDSMMRIYPRVKFKGFKDKKKMKFGKDKAIIYPADHDMEDDQNGIPLLVLSLFLGALMLGFFTWKSQRGMVAS